MGRARQLTSLIGAGSLDARVTALETGLGETNTNLSTLQDTVTGILSDILSLDSRLDSVEAALAGIASFASLHTSGTERFAVMPVNGDHISLYSLLVPDMLPGDIMMLFGQFEVTNDLGYTVGVARQILRTTSAGATTGTQISPAIAAMDNVDVNRHHMIAQATGAEVNPNTNGVYYNMCAWAVSTGGSGNLTIEPGYGRLVGVRLRNPL